MLARFEAVQPMILCLRLVFDGISLVLAAPAEQTMRVPTKEVLHRDLGHIDLMQQRLYSQDQLGPRSLVSVVRSQ